MLQHNRHGDRAHIAHAALIGMHAFCCGIPAVAMTLAATTGAAATGATAFSATTGRLHDVVHTYEVWIVAASAILVALGGLMEWRARRAGFPWLFAASLACFALNLVIILSHRL